MTLHLFMSWIEEDNMSEKLETFINLRHQASCRIIYVEFVLFSID